MTICPIALAVGCLRCSAFKFCPLTKVLGDQDKGFSSPFPNIQKPEENKTGDKDKGKSG